jgi:hypothetical protein
MSGGTWFLTLLLDLEKTVAKDLAHLRARLEQLTATGAGTVPEDGGDLLVVVAFDVVEDEDAAHPFGELRERALETRAQYRLAGPLGAGGRGIE